LQIEHATAGSAAFSNARNTALRFRGEILDHFGLVEQALSLVLVKAAELPEYAAFRPAFPHSLGLRLERLRKLIEAPGPLAAHRPVLAPLVERLMEYEEVRHFMAHGALEVARSETGETLFVFAFVQTKGGKPRDAHLVLDRRRAQAVAARLARDAEALTEQLGKVEAAMPGKGLSRTPRASGTPL
jgi:hypothetical protein